MTVTASDVTAIAPELSAVDPATIALFISDSELVWDLDAYNALKTGMRDYAQKNLVAFMLIDAGFGTGASERGEVLMERVGEVARTYAPTSKRGGSKITEDDLSRNRYGAAVLRIRRRYGTHLAWVGP